jgi:RTX calcium-binding nonapeptide repeat (4 copies)
MVAVLRLSLTLAVLIVELTANTAQASSVSVSGGVMTITANPGEENEISFAASGSDTRGPLVRVSDPGSNDSIPNSTSGGRIVAGGSCDQDSTGRNARCPTNGLTSVVVSLGDGDDEYEGTPERVATQLDLGAGDDSAALDTRSGVLNNLSGGTGDDEFDIGRSSGADVVNGDEDQEGDDLDTVTYASRPFAATATIGLTITLDGVAADGASGEGDNVQADVEKVVGTSRNDSLTGSAGRDTLEGGLGVDSFAGNAGVDTFRLRDGVRDNSFCLQPGETVDKDLKDPQIFIRCGAPSAQIAVGAQVFTGAVEEGPNVRIVSRRLRIARDRRVRVRLACPAKLRGSCAGRLTISEATRELPRIARVRYPRLRAGQSRVVTVRLGARSRRRALRRKAVALEAVEPGAHGSKTTFAVLPIR